VESAENKEDFFRRRAMAEINAVTRVISLTIPKKRRQSFHAASMAKA
jgi:hypothetical protein